MPKEFDACVKKGGKVRTIKSDANHYQHICWLHGKSYSGEVKVVSETAEAMMKHKDEKVGAMMKHKEEKEKEK